MEERFTGNTWKMWAGILIGLLVVGALFYTNIRQQRFVEVKQGSGTHCWKDQNQNGRTDLHLQSEFFECASGNYREERISDVLRTIHWSNSSLALILGAILFMALRDLFYMIRIRLLSEGALTWRAAFNTIMLWEFASALSPGVMSGSAVAMFILSRERISLGKSTTMVMVTAMLDNLFFSAMIPIVFLIYGGNALFPENSGAERVFWSGYTVFLLVFVFFFLSVFVLPGLVPGVVRLLGFFPFINRWRPSFEKTAIDIRIASLDMRSFRISFWLKLVGSTFGSWISRFLVINLLMAAFLSLDLFDHFLILSKQFILWLFMRMSPTPGGSGVAEYAFGELMSPLGGSILIVLGLAFVWRALSYYSYLIIGSLILPRWLRRVRQRRS